jgi:CRISPR-associated endonuclease/helicase Cas3
MHQYNEFYSDLLGFEPYRFQEKVADLLLNGKNVILSVPTGAGKTWASIMPFIYAKLGKKDNFPQKMIYSLPLRTLANSIYKDVSDLLSNPIVRQKYPQCFDLISIQTGEYSDDPYFEKEIVFSTIDQTLSNFLCFPLSLSHNQANINAGSIIGSYLVFDEFHLLDTTLSMSTTIGMLLLLKNLCRVCIMTATLTDDYIRFLEKELKDFEVVSIKDFPDDILKIKSLIPAKDKTIKKSIHVCESVLNASMILEKHQNKTIVICNRVETAQCLYIEIEKNKKESTKLICIHSRFFDTDRKIEELKIKEFFGKNSLTKDVILISTQVIEAGMDISCDVLFTEISPINSFLQRAGRCARFEGEYGNIYVFDILSIKEKELISENDVDKQDVDEINKLNNKYLPYSKELCQNSLEALKLYKYIDEKVSNSLINKVLAETEKESTRAINDSLCNKDEIRNSWLDCNKKHYRKTIRDIQSIELVLFDVESNRNEKIIPWKYESISVYRLSFIGWIKKIRKENPDSDDWIIAKAEQSSNSQFDDDWENNTTSYLRRLDLTELKNYYDIIFIDNRYFDYNKAGLIICKNDNQINSPIKKLKVKESINITFKKDTFYQHSKALLNCYEREFKPKMSFLIYQLDKFWGNKVDWDKLIKITICFHDYGKLNKAWQKPMLEYQRKKMKDSSYFEILAHTDYDELNDIELAKECKINSKPSHAGIGSVQVYDMLYNDYREEIARVAGCAILKHHSVETNSFETFSILDSSLNDLIKLMKELKLKYDFDKNERGESLLDIIPNKTKDKEWLLYFIIVRILRLCDHKATESIDKYYKI